MQTTRSRSQCLLVSYFDSWGQGSNYKVLTAGNSNPEMPRRYVKKGRNAQWTRAQLAAALDAVQHGMSIRGAAARYAIPVTTLHDHVSGKSTRVHSGAPTVFTSSEEKEIERICQVMQDLAFPLTKELVSIVVRDYLRDNDRGDRFKDGVPGNDWWYGFFRRHPKLVERKPELLPKCRAQGANPEVE